MKNSFSRREITFIEHCVSSSISDAFQNLSQSEPQLVANLVATLPRRINTTLSQSSRIKISAGGVFVHARPFVQCHSFPQPSPKSVEIGDLLFIVNYAERGQITERRALLLQAKKTKKIPTTPDNPNQWHIYSDWPQFTYAARSGSLTGQQRYICEPDMYDAAKYMFIGDTGIEPKHHRLSHHIFAPYKTLRCPYKGIHSVAKPTANRLSQYNCLICELVSLITGKAGKKFKKPAINSIGWDQVVEDLIKNTADAASVYCGRALGKPSGQSRGSGILFLCGEFSAYSSIISAADGSYEGNFNIPPEVPGEWQDDESEGGGISTIEITVELNE